MEALKSIIRDIPDFPKKGILFKDITPLLADGAAFQNMIEAFKARYQGKGIDQVVGIEARGFVFAAPLAYALGAGVTLVRKPDKLPHKTYKQTYALEYGTDALEIHQDALKPGQKILVIDDVLATGGTLAATALLIRTYFPEVEFHEAAFLMELGFLNGREKLGGLPVFPLFQCCGENSGQDAEGNLELDGFEKAARVVQKIRRDHEFHEAALVIQRARHREAVVALEQAYKVADFFLGNLYLDLDGVFVHQA